ncbi:MAG TPA: hypothetical protein VKV80_13120 [Streptosporangiaceae bacterium]|nr:hypothetical protein [Streptosporangiaceae bacterium]
MPLLPDAAVPGHSGEPGNPRKAREVSRRAGGRENVTGSTGQHEAAGRY